MKNNTIASKTRQVKNLIKKHIKFENTNSVLNNISNYLLEKCFQIKISQINAEGKYKIFNNPIIMNKWGQEASLYFEESREICSMGYIHNESIEAKNRKEELEHIKLYCGFSDKNINNWLRNNSDTCYNKSIKNSLDRLINRFEIKDNIIVVRRIYDKNKIKQLKVKDIFSDNAFLSTSLDINYRLNYNCEKRKLYKEAICIIKVPKGTNGVYIQNALEEDKRKNEYEVLFNRETLLKVEYKIKIFSNYLFVLKMINSRI